MSWQPVTFVPVLHEARKYTVGKRELVARVNVYRHDERQIVFYERTAEATDDGEPFLPMERAFVAEQVSRANAVHFASRTAQDWFRKVSQAVNQAQAQNGAPAPAPTSSASRAGPSSAAST